MAVQRIAAGRQAVARSASAIAERSANSFVLQRAALREDWVDSVGLGRMVLSYPEIFLDAAQGRAVQHKRICRTFSDCTTAPRNGLPSGCYPLDSHYKTSPASVQLAVLKAKR